MTERIENRPAQESQSVQEPEYPNEPTAHGDLPAGAGALAQQAHHSRRREVVLNPEGACEGTRQGITKLLLAVQPPHLVFVLVREHLAVALRNGARQFVRPADPLLGRHYLADQRLVSGRIGAVLVVGEQHSPELQRRCERGYRFLAVRVRLRAPPRRRFDQPPADLECPQIALHLGAIEFDGHLQCVQ